MAKKKEDLPEIGDTATVADRWLSEVQIQRFKAAFRPEPIPLRPFNVVIGRNGSGKSTLLEALQWLDATIRRDAREACDRYYGIQDLINLRSPADKAFFELALTWSAEDEQVPPVRYQVKVEDRQGAPFIAEEGLETLRMPGRPLRRYLVTKSPGERAIEVADANGWGVIHDPDRLALGLIGSSQWQRVDPALAFLESFWSRAVFLRLSPNRLAQGSLATRKSFEPLLDEEGQSLPALLNELTPDQRVGLVDSLKEVLPGEFPERQFPARSWMLSEGTRRVTAILALLARGPKVIHGTSISLPCLRWPLSLRLSPQEPAMSTPKTARRRS